MQGDGHFAKFFFDGRNAEEDGKVFVTGDVVYLEPGERPREMIEGRAVLGEMPAQEL